jgi:hypothetical protein
MINLKLTATILLLSSISFVFGQPGPDGFVKSQSVNTKDFYSKKIQVRYTLSWDEDVKRRLVKSKNLIFSDSVNNFSKMDIIYDVTYKLEAPKSISTILIDDIIIDDSNELILCLSRKIFSPFQLALYNFKGELLYKKHIHFTEVVLDSISLITFRDSFPDFFHFARENKEITNIGGTYFIDQSYWFVLSESQRDRMWKFGWVKGSHYFPYLIPEFQCGTTSLKKFTNFYSRTDPFYEFEIKDSKPVSIILNDEYGGKVKIPIVY